MKTILSLFTAFFILSISPAHAFNMFGGSEQFRIASTPPYHWVWDNKLGKPVPGPKPTAEEVNEGYEGDDGEDGEDDE